MGRTEVTENFLQERGAEWTSDDELRRVDHYGDPDAEYEAVAQGGLAIMERGRRDTLVISGEDAVPWLQGLVTSDLHELVDEGNGQRTAFVNTTGRFVGEARVLHLPELLLLDMEPGTLDGGLYSHLRQHIILEKVNLDDRSDATARVGFFGERAAEVLERLADWKYPPGERPPFHGSWSRWSGRDLIVQRVVWSRLPGFEICCDVDTVVPLMEAIETLEGSLPLIGHRTFETMRIEDGVPRFGTELHDRVIPLEAHFDDAISYEKGCYLGQEIIARLDSRGIPAKLLRRVVLDGKEVPQPGTTVYSVDDEKKIGHVESAAYSPRHDAPVALAFVKRNHNDIGNTVCIDDAEGRLQPLLDLTALS